MVLTTVNEIFDRRSYWKVLHMEQETEEEELNEVLI